MSSDHLRDALNYAVHTGSSPMQFNSDRLASMIVMRLRPAEGTQICEFLAAHVCKNMVHVFIVTSNGEAAVIDDEWPMFPSDALITKLRLIM